MARILLLLFLASCGGGGGGSSTAIQEIITPRKDLLYGYYGGCPQCLDETKGHINLYHVTHWDGDGIADMQRAKAFGIGVMLDLPEAYMDSPVASENAVRDRLQKLQALDLLTIVKAIYLTDEPDLAGKVATEIMATNAMVRRVAAEFNLDVPLAVTYSALITWPGIQYYDWVGFDNYDANIFDNGDYAKLKAVTRANQRILLEPGGADKWRQDPSPYLAKAQQDLQVVAIIAFIWRDNADPKNGAHAGIRSNGMAKAYCSTGQQATQKAGIC